jgi:hypothetical protein
VNLFYTKPQTAENMNSSNQQSCVYYERFSRRKYNRDEQIANAIKSQDADNDFLYCRSSFRKALGFSEESLVSSDFLKQLNPILEKKKIYTIRVWSENQRIAKKISTKVQVQLFEAGYKVKQKQRQLDSLSSYEKSCKKGQTQVENIHILLNDTNKAKLAICNKGGWKWI